MALSAQSSAHIIRNCNNIINVIISMIIYPCIAYHLATCILQATNTVRFEIDDKKLSELLGQVADVGKAIDSYAHS